MPWEPLTWAPRLSSCPLRSLWPLLQTHFSEAQISVYFSHLTPRPPGAPGTCHSPGCSYGVPPGPPSPPRCLPEPTSTTRTLCLSPNTPSHLNPPHVLVLTVLHRIKSHSACQTEPAAPTSLPGLQRLGALTHHPALSVLWAYGHPDRSCEQLVGTYGGQRQSLADQKSVPRSVFRKKWLLSPKSNAWITHDQERGNQRETPPCQGFFPNKNRQDRRARGGFCMFYFQPQNG